MKKTYLSKARFNGKDFFIRDENKDLPGTKDYTTVFQEDLSRIIRSSAFRRLKNKTQVHPLANNDYVRNRLTHSLEVSEIGQLIMNGVGMYISESNHLPSKFLYSDLKDIIASAALIHDIGNPPFGHIGEEAIQCFFEGNQKRRFLKKVFKNEDVKHDFLSFDGNAQGFRVVNRLQNWRNKGGLRLSLAAIAASVKYPWSSVEAENRIGKKKFGYMHNDKEIFCRIFSKLKLKHKKSNNKKGQETIFFRHPLSYIVEAADDIAYLTTDIVDGVKKGYIEYSTAYELLDSCSASFHKKRLFNIDKRNKDDRLDYLSCAAVSTLIDTAFTTFVSFDNYKNIQQGEFFGTLLENSDYHIALEDIRSECRQNLYGDRGKLEIEAGAHFMIQSVLKMLINTANDYFKSGRNVDSMRKKYRDIFYLLPKEVTIHNFRNENEESVCYRMLDYVAGMTDNYLVYTYKTFFGGRDYFN